MAAATFSLAVMMILVTNAVFARSEPATNIAAALDPSKIIFQEIESWFSITTLHKQTRFW